MAKPNYQYEKRSKELAKKKKKEEKLRRRQNARRGVGDAEPEAETSEGGTAETQAEQTPAATPPVGEA